MGLLVVAVFLFSTGTIQAQSSCGDGMCTTGESCSTCSQDCGSCPQSTSCSDSDGGTDFDVFGTITYTNNFGEEFSGSDHCWAFTQYNMLRERHCDGNQPTWTDHKCPSLCIDGRCTFEPDVCSNGVCEAGEDVINCPTDCESAPVCPNGHCEAGLGESPFNCPADCGTYLFGGCANQICDVYENEYTCPQDCGSVAVCGDGVCEHAETPYSCAGDCDTSSNCGDNICEKPTENYAICSDCSTVCGDGMCNGPETTANCAIDCEEVVLRGFVSSVISSITLPGEAETKLSRIGELDTSNGLTGRLAYALHVNNSFEPFINWYTANVTSNHEWVLRSNQLSFLNQGERQTFEAGNPSHYLVLNTELQGSCWETDGYLDGQRVRVRTKGALSGQENTCTLCGDGWCDFWAGETCPQDCSGATCGNGVCDGTETCSTCSADCGQCGQVCGDGVCQASETCSSCTTDCGSCGGQTEIIRPDGSGFRKAWTNVGCNPGSSEWQCVSESQPDTSDYLRSIRRDKETFTFADVSFSEGLVTSVTLYYYAQQYNTESNSCFEALVRAGGSDYLGGAQMCANISWQYFSHKYDVNPVTGQPWTIAEVNSLEAGMRGEQPDAGGRVAQVYAEVEYTASEPSGSSCGDSVCEGGETSQSCPQDCTGLEFTKVASLPLFINLLTLHPSLDIDRDGKREIVGRRDAGDIFVTKFGIYEAAGDNAYVLAQENTMSNASSMKPVDMGDSDGDSLNELLTYGRVIGGSGDFFVRLYEQATQNTYPSISSQPVWETLTSWWPVGARITDLDQDANKDIVFGYQDVSGEIGTLNIEVHENTGDNTFAKRYSTVVPGIITAQCFAVLDDVDADGKNEMIAGGVWIHPSGDLQESREILRMYESTGDNSYAEIWTVDLELDGLMINCGDVRYAGDMDQDGKREFIVGGWKIGVLPPLSIPGNTTYHIFEAAGDNAFNKVATISEKSTQDSAITIFDVDGDGSNEVILTVNDPIREDFVKVYGSIGDNQYAEKWSHSWSRPGNIALHLNSIGAGDYDNDGKVDLIFNEYEGSSRTVIYESNTASVGPTMFLAPVPSYLNTDVTLVANVADSNGLLQCERCLSLNDSCDGWTTQGVVHNFPAGETQGQCSFYWNVSNYVDGNYSVNMRVININSSTATAQQFSFLDTTSPIIRSDNMPSVVHAGVNFTLKANITDNHWIESVNASIGSYSTILQKNVTGFYQAEITTPAELGSSAFTIEATDLAGNRITIERSINIDEQVTWSQDVVLARESTLSPSPDIATDGSGNRHIVWESTKDANPEIYYSKLDSEGEILVHDLRLTSNVYNSKNPAVATDAQGYVHIVWQDDREGNKEIYYSKLDTAGSLLLSTVRITSNTFNSENPEVYVDNNVHIVWKDDRDGQYNLFYKKIDSTGNIVVADTQLTTDGVTKYDIGGSSNLHLVYTNLQGSVQYLQTDKSGNVQFNNQLTTGNDPAVAAETEVAITFIDQGNNLQLYVLDPAGTILNSWQLTDQGTASQPDVVLDGAIQIVWKDSRSGAGELYYTKRTTTSPLVSPQAISINASNVVGPEIAAGSADIVYYDSAQEGVFLKTTELDTVSPEINGVQISSIGDFGATVSWTTNEFASSKVSYSTTAGSGLSKEDTALKKDHSVSLTLNPSTQYFVTVESADVFGNTVIDDRNGAQYTFWTGTPANRPSLPTSFYGQVILDNGTGAVGVEVIATWTDTNDVQHTTTTTTLGPSEAAALNDSSLLGYFVFNRGNVKAKPGSLIVVSVGNDITDPDPFVNANPGGTSAEVTGGPIVIDTNPPQVTIASPQSQTFTTPFLSLEFSVNEPIQWASFQLNEQDNVTITQLQNQQINITASFGQNRVTVYARDLVGLEGSGTVTFTVEDAIPPLVQVNNIGQVSGSVLTIADVSDSTNVLAETCEVCISNDGNCDTEWIPATNGFSDGDMSGRCTYNWDTTASSEGQYTVNFRVSDVANNLGEGTSAAAFVDNTPPNQISLTVTPIPGTNSMDLVWGTSSASDLQHYNVYRSNSNFIDISQAILIATTADISYTDGGLDEKQTYFYAVTAVDNLGNENTAVISVPGTVPDLAPPTIVVQQPQSASYSTEVPLEFTTDEAINWCGYSLNGGNNITVQSPTSFVAQEGVNNIIIYCHDLQGNSGASGIISFTVDITAPNPVPITTVQQVGTQVLLDWQASNAPDFKAYKIYREESDYNDVSNLIPLAEINEVAKMDYADAIAEEGITYFYSVTAEDTTGLVNQQVTTKSITVLDQIPPGLIVISPTPSLYATLTVPLDISSSEDVTNCSYHLNGLQGVEFTNQSTLPAVEGANTVFVVCLDHAGNVGTSPFVNFTSDVTPPAVVSSLQAINTGDADSINLSWQSVSDADLKEYRVYRSTTNFSNIDSLSPVAITTQTRYVDGGLAVGETYYYAVTAADQAGNELSPVQVVSETISDMQPPEVALTNPVHNSKLASQTVSIVFSASESVSLCRYTLDGGAPTVIASGSTIQVQEGLHTIFVDCTDSVGNLGMSDVINFTVDATPPSQVEGLTVNLVPRQNQLNLSWNNALESDVTEYRVYRATASFSDVSSLSPLAVSSTNQYTDSGLQSEQTYFYAVAAVDDGGNVDTNVISVSGTVADTLPPEKIVGLQVSTVPQQNELSLTWNPSGAQDFDHYNVYRSQSNFLDVGELQSLTTLTGTNYVDTNLIPGGEYFYAVTAVDASGNELIAVDSVKGVVADIVPPNVTLTSPESKVYGSQIIPLEYESTEEVTNCVYTLNGVAQSATPTITAAEGSSTIQLSCEDLVGNIGTSDSVFFSVDTTPPAPVEGLQISINPSQDSLTAAWSPNSEPDVQQYKIYRSQSEFTDVSSASLVAQTAALSFIDQGLTSETTYFYAVTAVDNLGNENGNVQTASATVADILPPAISITSPTDTTYTTTTVNLTYAVNEASSCTYSLNSQPEIEVSGIATLQVSEGSNSVVISCIDNANNEGVGSVSFDINIDAPAQVQGLVVDTVTGENSLELRWTPSSATDLASYNIYRDTADFTDVLARQPIASINNNVYTDTGLQSEQAYFYAITAADIYDHENTSVNAVSGVVADTAAPAKVNGLQVTPIQDEVRLQLTWNPSEASDFAHYNIFRSTEDFTSIINLSAIASATDTTYTDSAVFDGVAYFYAVVAVDHSGNAFVDVDTASAITLDLTAPEVFVSDIGNQAAGTVVLTASVIDTGTGLQQSCEVCISVSSCDTWTPASSNFNPADTNGTCTYAWDTSNEAQTTYAYNFRVSDIDGNLGEGVQKTVDIVNVSGVRQAVIGLKTGWNFFSVPLEPQDQSIEAVLAPIAGKYNQVFFYETSSEVWQSYKPDRSVFDQPNDLQQLTAGRSYWIHVTEDVAFTILGFTVTNYESTLEEGWNYIGYPYAGSTSISEALATLEGAYNRVYTYDADSDKWDVYTPNPTAFEPNSINDLQAGKGYLIDMNLPAVWRP